MPDRNSHSSDTSRERTGPRVPDKAVLIVFALALLIRVFYLIELSVTPGFDFPIIDSATYSEIAKNIHSNGVLDPRLFWQGFFYPLFLSGIFALSGASITAARIFQIILGSMTCVMVLLTARMLLDRRRALLAAIATALYGPLVFFEGELLATGWAAFWMICLLYLVVRCDRGWSVAGFLVSGTICGLAVATRPTFYPAVVVSMIIILWRMRLQRELRRVNLFRIFAMAGGFLAVVIVISILSYSTTGHFSPIPRSGSLNLYIGNNQDTDETMMIRPGSRWRNLTREPELLGYIDDSGYREYFMNRFKVYVATRPGSFTRGLFDKSTHLLSSREMPRNVDIYSSRLESGLMRVLVWKYGGFGFPFGILLPFIVLGFIFAPKTRNLYLWTIPLVYSCSLVLVFIASRYRTALIPVLVIVASAGAYAAFERFRRGTVAQKSLIIAIFIATALLATVPGPFTVEKFDYAAEKYASIGYEMGKAGAVEEAESVIRRSVELNPHYAAGHRMLGNILNQAGKPDEALRHLRIALQEEPDSYMTHFYLALALARQGIDEEAYSHLHKAREGATRSRDRESLRQIESFSAMMTRGRDESK